jgi:hypothetical protein
MSPSCVSGRVTKRRDKDSSWGPRLGSNGSSSSDERTSRRGRGSSRWRGDDSQRRIVLEVYGDPDEGKTPPLYQHIKQIQDGLGGRATTLDASNGSGVLTAETLSGRTSPPSTDVHTPVIEAPASSHPELEGARGTRNPAQTWEDFDSGSEYFPPRPIECQKVYPTVQQFSSQDKNGHRTQTHRRSTVWAAKMNTTPSHIGVHPLSLSPSDVQAYHSVMSFIHDETISSLDQLTSLCVARHELSPDALRHAYEALKKFEHYGGDFAASFQQRVTQGRSSSRRLEEIVSGSDRNDGW